MSRLLSVNVGLPREVIWNGKKVRTAIWKNPVQERLMVHKLNIVGDAQADLAGHGGEQRAVFVYQIESYQYWERVLSRNDFIFGQFGENFTVEGLSDNEVCIGDQYRIGQAVFEVTQPRVTCYRLGIRMNDPRMPALLVSHKRPGFYLRVLCEGEVGQGDEIVKIADGPERMTVAETDALLYLPGHPRPLLEKALRIPALSEGWKWSFRTLIENQSSTDNVSVNPGLATEQSAPAWQGFRQMRVADIRKESDSVTSFILRPVDGQVLPIAQPGQFIALRLQIEPDKPPVIRSYSLSDLPSGHHFRISVRAQPGGIASSFLCTHLRTGDLLEVAAPRGTFILRSDESPVVLLSAGVGATPLISMLHALTARHSEQQVWWIYGARDGANHPFARESAALSEQLLAGRQYIVYSKPRPADRLGVDFDAVGHLDLDLLRRIAVPTNAQFYLCGPPQFLESLLSGLRDWGVPVDDIHSESFNPLEAITPGTTQSNRHPHVPEGPAQQGPSVSFARSGITVNWGSQYRNLLELAEACDVPVRWSCRTGVCHLCITGVIGGSVSYSPEPLEKPSPGNVLICCSRPDENLVLDL